MSKVAFVVFVPILVFIMVIMALMGSINVALRRNESNIDEYDDSVMDPAAELDPFYMDGTTIYFIISCYYPDSPEDSMGGNDTTADGTKYFRDPNLPPESNLFAKTPDGRTIQGVVATVQDQYYPLLPWSLKESIRLSIPCYHPAAEVHDHFGTTSTDPRRLDLAMSGKEQNKKFREDLATTCPEAKPYQDPTGNLFNNGTLLPVKVTYLLPEGQDLPNAQYGELSTHRQLLLNLAFAQLGKPYVWGAEGPNSFDCSGLVLWLYSQIGNSVPKAHHTNVQMTHGKYIDASEVLPGDCIYFSKNGFDWHHVGIYIGGDSYLHAPYTGEVVRIDSLSKRTQMKRYVRFMDPDKDYLPVEANTDDSSS